MNYIKILQEGTLYDANKKAFDDFIDWGKGYWNQVDENAVKALKKLEKKLNGYLSLAKAPNVEFKIDDGRAGQGWVDIDPNKMSATADFVVESETEANRLKDLIADFLEKEIGSAGDVYIYEQSTRTQGGESYEDWVVTISVDLFSLSSEDFVGRMTDIGGRRDGLMSARKSAEKELHDAYWNQFKPGMKFKFRSAVWEIKSVNYDCFTAVSEKDGKTRDFYSYDIDDKCKFLDDSPIAWGEL